MPHAVGGVSSVNPDLPNNKFGVFSASLPGVEEYEYAEHRSEHGFQLFLLSIR